MDLKPTEPVPAESRLTEHELFETKDGYSCKCGWTAKFLARINGVERYALHLQDVIAASSALLPVGRQLEPQVVDEYERTMFGQLDATVHALAVNDRLCATDREALLWGLRSLDKFYRAASLPVGVSRHVFPDAFTIEVELEDDGRWLAEVDEVPGAMAYGSQPLDAIRGALWIAEIGRADSTRTQEPE